MTDALRISRWPAAVVALIAFNMVVVGVTLYFAANDPSVAVEPDYYRRALDWDAEARQRAASERLGWRAMVRLEADRTLRLRLEDRDGAPISGAGVRATAFAEARSGDRSELLLGEAAPGEYTAPFEPSRAGRWVFRVEAVRPSDDPASGVPGQRFVSEVRTWIGLTTNPSAGGRRGP